MRICGIGENCDGASSGISENVESGIELEYVDELTDPLVVGSS
jgi:hypothetical protein